MVRNIPARSTNVLNISQQSSVFSSLDKNFLNVQFLQPLCMYRSEVFTE